ncbi:MAG TPA: S53 family peptidase [Terriglobales bacterium]|nr:S53 family peptidase [Terriglobales bacterium]
MKLKLFLVVTLCVLLACSGFAAAQAKRVGGKVYVPDSSMERWDQIGRSAHTNIRVFLPAESPRNQKATGAPYPGYAYETPASLACVYGLVSPVAGCNPNQVTAVPSGGGKMIAIVDAYDAPHAASDLAAFSTQFGLPAANFQVVYASGSKPAYDMGWEFEESLDVQWAHAMAPSAKIVLVEAASSSFSDLMKAEDLASNMVAAAGGGEVSNSWGGSEFGSETGYDSHFAKAGVVYVASSGDNPGTSWPGTSPNVVSAGGTTVRRNPSTAAFISEAPWDSAGGGISTFEPRPVYQNAISSTVGNYRGVPDLSFDANPVTGVWIYDSSVGGWNIVGGTSVASPALAGIINLSGKFNTSTSAELQSIYNNRTTTADFNDIASGYCGPYGGYTAVAGWDPCTGVGTNKGTAGK